jgi:RecA-family ATPase
MQQRVDPADPELEPLEVVDVCALQGLPIEPLEWIWEDWIPMRVATGFYADGGWGKSTLGQQLQACTALRRPFLGHEVRYCKSLLVACEDERRVLHSRQAVINAKLGVDFANYDPGMAQWICRAGKPSLMAVFDQRGRLEPTPFYSQVVEQARDTGAQLVILDGSKDVFGGQESDRSQVAQFVTLLTGFAQLIDGGVILFLHPSLTGRASGTGESGTTAWDAAFRSRIYGPSRRPGKDEEEATLDDGRRTLIRIKANYAQRGVSLALRLQEGSFALAQPAPGAGANGDAKAAIERIVMNGLLELAARDQRCSLYKGQAHWAPKSLLTYSRACEGYSETELHNALARLIKQGRVKNVTEGPPSRERSYLVVVDPEFKL